MVALPRPCTRQAALGIHLFSCFEGLSQESSAVPGVLALTVVSSGRCRLFCLHPPSSVSPTLADTLPLPPQLLCFWGGCGADQAVDFSTLLGWGGATSFQPGLPCTPLPGGMMVQRPWWGSWEVLCWSSGLTLYASLSLSLSGSLLSSSRGRLACQCAPGNCSPHSTSLSQENQGGRRGRGPGWGLEEGEEGEAQRLACLHCPLFGRPGSHCGAGRMLVLQTWGVRGWVRVLGESPKWHSGSPSWLTGLLLM